MSSGMAKLFDYEWTQDTWIWKGKPKTLQNVEFTMGLPACDNRLAYEIAQVGLKPVNPSKDIKTYHLHLSNKRTYTERNRLAGPTMPLPCITADLMRNKTCLIIQPGKVGDIICVLPIAKWYADRGFEVYWQCPKQYHELFSYVDYVTPVETVNGRYDKTIDLAFGINQRSQHHGVWMRKRRMIDSFVTLKYEIAGVPL